MTADLDVILAPAFMTGVGLRHGFFARGAVPAGDPLYRGMNCGQGSHDAPGRVAANRALALERLGLDRLYTARQVHGAAVAHPDDFGADGARPAADVVVVDRPGDAAGVLTADCGPVLFADEAAGIAAAAHAGWRGALGGALEAAIEAMCARGAQRQRIAAALGPTIGPLNYEVGEELEAQFRATDPAAAAFFAPGCAPDKRWFDLPAYILMRLDRAGVAAAWTGQDTLADPERFFSARHSGRTGAGDYGRMLAAIGFAGS